MPPSLKGYTKRVAIEILKERKEQRLEVLVEGEVTRHVLAFFARR